MTDQQNTAQPTQQQVFMEEEQDEGQLLERLRAISEEHTLPEEDVKSFYEEAFKIAQSVSRRALFSVVKFAQYRVNELMEKGLNVAIYTSVYNTKDGVKAIIDYVPSRDQLLELVKSRAFKTMIKRYDKEVRKSEREIRQIERITKPKD